MKTIVGEESGKEGREIVDDIITDTSVMEDNIQSLPQNLRTNHPKRWTTENVCDWMTGTSSVLL